MSLAKWIPESIKAPIRGSRVFRDSYHKLHAERLARTSKRLDLCAAQFAHFLHLAQDTRLQGATCLELGSGWVLTHALVCHLLGARRVIAIDVERAARPSALRGAVHSASASVVRDLLAPFAEHEAVRERLDRLLRTPRFDFDALAALGIEYRAPIDLSREPLPERFDLIYSVSVLEHVPLEDVQPLLANLSAQLAPGGAMLHAIHLEDHRDIAGDPFAFLGAPSFSRVQQTERGNRMRASAWLRAFDAVPELSHRVLWSWQRRDRPLPTPSMDVAAQGEDDLRTSHLGIVARKHGSGPEPPA